jgi:hypothetical protein
MMIGFLNMTNGVKAAKTRQISSQNKNIIRARKDYSLEAILYKLGNGVKSALEMIGKSLQKTLFVRSKNNNADFTRTQKDCRAIILNALKNVLKSTFWLFGISSAKAVPNAFDNDKARHMRLERVDLTSRINACLQGIYPFGRINSDNTKYIPKPINIGSQNKNIDFAWAQKDYPFKRVISDNLNSSAKSKFELFNTPNAKNKANGHDRVLITKFVKTSLSKNVCWKRQASALKNSMKAAFNLFDDAADKDKKFLSLQKTRDVLKNDVKSALEMIGKSLQKTLFVRSKNNNADFTRAQKDYRAIILNALKNGVKVALNLFDNAADKDKRFLGLQKTRDALKNSDKSAPELLSVLNASRLTIGQKPRRTFLAMRARMPLKNICEIKDDNFKR